MVDLPDMRYWKDLVLPMEGDPDANNMGFQSLNNGGYLKKGTRMRGRIARQRGKQNPDIKDVRTQAGLARGTEVSNVA